MHNINVGRGGGCVVFTEYLECWLVDNEFSFQRKLLKRFGYKIESDSLITTIGWQKLFSWRGLSLAEDIRLWDDVWICEKDGGRVHAFKYRQLKYEYSVEHNSMNMLAC